MSRDDALMIDMLVAARHARQHIEGLGKEAFLASKLHQDAVVRELEVLGEASGNVSEETREKHPEIEWARIVGMRNRLTHEYFRVNLEIVWTVATAELPELIRRLGEILPQETP